MVVETSPDVVRDRLGRLERELVERGSDLALYLAFDRPQRAEERPGVTRTFFVERCASDAHLTQITNAFREIKAYVERFDGEEPFFRALAEGRLQAMAQPLKVVYNEIEGGIRRMASYQDARRSYRPSPTRMGLCVRTRMPTRVQSVVTSSTTPRCFVSWASGHRHVALPPV